jgi:uncharacterized protein (UPF0218 family)/phosphopantetheine adenylyltransferase
MFRHALVAGTFDHLHQGHHKLLLTALHSAEKLSCGLTRPGLTKTKPLASLIEPRTTRLNALSRLLPPHSIFPLTDPLEPAASSNQFDSIIASTATRSTVDKINQLRLKRNLEPLKTILINLVKASDSQILSSTRIRQGQINRQGFAYHQIFPQAKTLKLPSLHHHHFKKPFDTLLKGSPTHLAWSGLQAKQLLKKQPSLLTIAVGDIAVITLLQQKIPLNLALVDLKTQRRALFRNLDALGLHPNADHTVPNPPSTLTPQLIGSLKSALTPSLQPQTIHQTILVRGEEDLAVLPTVLLSPLNTAIFYGQPHQGLVYIRVTETNKQKALDLLRKFT